MESPTSYGASATAYGLGCGIPPLGFVPAAQPIIGTTASAVVANAPRTVATVRAGSSNIAAFPVSLPFELSGVGMLGCYRHQSNEIFGLLLASRSSMQLDAEIPFDLSLINQHVYTQAFCFAPGTKRLEIVTSNGIDWQIGNR